MPPFGVKSIVRSVENVNLSGIVVATGLTGEIVDSKPEKYYLVLWDGFKIPVKCIRKDVIHKMKGDRNDDRDGRNKTKNVKECNPTRQCRGDSKTRDLLQDNLEKPQKLWKELVEMLNQYNDDAFDEVLLQRTQQPCCRPVVSEEVRFANYPQNEHPLKFDYSSGPSNLIFV